MPSATMESQNYSRQGPTVICEVRVSLRVWQRSSRISQMSRTRSALGRRSARDSSPGPNPGPIRESLLVRTALTAVLDRDQSALAGTPDTLLLDQLAIDSPAFDLQHSATSRPAYRALFQRWGGHAAAMLTKAGIESPAAPPETNRMMPRAMTETRLRPASPMFGSVPNMDLGTDSVTIPVRLCNLPPFHAVANQVMALTADPEIGSTMLSKVIGSDTAFAAEILFLANSSLFGFPSRVSSLRHAIALLGTERIKALAVTVAMRGFLGNGTAFVHQCWRHSAACAMVCEELAAAFDLSPDQAFTAGIMHDVGRLALLKSYPKGMASILTREYANLRDLLVAEREVFKVDHALAGFWLAARWALPMEFQSICGHHHDAPTASDSVLLRVLKASCAIACSIGFPAVRFLQSPSFDEACALFPPQTGRKALPPEEDLRSNVTARLAALQY
jgi:HD-like signal output (HDOD) protein